MGITEIQNILNHWGIKQQWLADKLGVSKHMLSMWLTGTRDMPEEINNNIKEILSALKKITA